MRLVLLGALLAGCVGRPDRLEIEAGRGSGGFESPKGLDWDVDSHWVGASLQFPITYGRTCERSLSRPPPAPREAPPVAPAVAPEKPWWEDYSLVLALVTAVGGAIAAKGAGPAVQKCRTALARRRERKSASG